MHWLKKMTAGIRTRNFEDCQNLKSRGFTIRNNWVTESKNLGLTWNIKTDDEWVIFFRLTIRQISDTDFLYIIRKSLRVSNQYHRLLFFSLYSCRTMFYWPRKDTSETSTAQEASDFEGFLKNFLPQMLLRWVGLFLVSKWRYFW